MSLIPLTLLVAFLPACDGTDSIEHCETDCEPVEMSLLGIDEVTGQLLTLDPAEGTGAGVGELGQSIEALAYDTTSQRAFGVTDDTDQLVAYDTQRGEWS